MRLTLDITKDTGFGTLHLKHTISDRTQDDVEIHTTDAEEIKERMLRFVETSLAELDHDEVYKAKVRKEISDALKDIPPLEPVTRRCRLPGEDANA